MGVKIRRDMRVRSRPEAQRHRTTGKTAHPLAVSPDEQMAQMLEHLKGQGVDITKPPTGSIALPSADVIADIVQRSEEAVREAAELVPSDTSVGARIKRRLAGIWSAFAGFFRRGDS